MNRDYFTLEAASREVNRTEEELLFLVETRALRASLYVKKRKFCVLAKHAETGRANYVGTSVYRGLALISDEDQLDLVEKGKAIVRILIPTGIVNEAEIDKVNPFKEAIGPCGGIRWRYLEREALDNLTFYLHTFPVEKIKTASLIYKAVKLFSEFENDSDPSAEKKIHNNDPLTEKGLAYSYDITRNGEYSLADLRFRGEDLEKANLFVSKKSTINSTETSDQVRLLWCENKVNPTSIDKVVERAFISNKSLSSKGIWKLLHREYKGKEKSFDLDQVIEKMDSDCIEWLKKDFETKRLLYKTFENKVSTIRKFYVAA
tara:strand:- start:7728 stop:8681 length:954 start_codon:yes stop_codon:yes gene_type:complete